MPAIGKAGDTNILLESGTNELEIVEFAIDGNIYGINVAKVREIIKYPDNVVDVPDSHPSFEGIADIRGQVIPMINLPRHLGSPSELDKDSSYIIISEFNNSMIGFCVTSVSRIHRLSWKQLESPSGMLSSEEGVVTAIVKFDDRMAMLLDFEKITSDINPDSGMQADTSGEQEANSLELDRSLIKILIAEDSAYILKLIVKKLEGAGYQVTTASDGQIAWNLLTATLNDNDFNTINDHFHIIISDIEMPQMDGLHLIKNIKSHEMLQHIPCVVFSSLINDEMSLKCKSVGADAEISKPEMGNLVELIDKFAISLNITN
jgi:two-component system chemotaxis response regulator CheV